MRKMVFETDRVLKFLDESAQKALQMSRYPIHTDISSYQISS